MTYEKALSLFRNDKTLQILRAEHFPLLVSFFHLLFKQQDRITYHQSDLAAFWKERMKGKTKKWGWEIPRFDDVHPGMAVPFHEPACFFLSAPVEALREHKWLHGFAKGRSQFHTYEM